MYDYKSLSISPPILIFDIIYLDFNVVFDKFDNILGVNFKINFRMHTSKIKIS
jgi:hypothetical protein